MIDLARVTAEQHRLAVELLADLVAISPVVGVGPAHLGHCHYCGRRVRNVHSQLINHTEECPWRVAHEFTEGLPSDWD